MQVDAVEQSHKTKLVESQLKVVLRTEKNVGISMLHHHLFPGHNIIIDSKYFEFYIEFPSINTRENQYY